MIVPEYLEAALRDMTATPLPVIFNHDASSAYSCLYFKVSWIFSSFIRFYKNFLKCQGWVMPLCFFKCTIILKIKWRFELRGTCKEFRCAKHHTSFKLLLCYLTVVFHVEVWLIMSINNEKQSLKLGNHCCYTAIFSPSCQRRQRSSLPANWLAGFCYSQLLCIDWKLVLDQCPQAGP